LGPNFQQVNLKHFGRPRDQTYSGLDSIVAVNIENNRLIPGIVYLRDCTILETLDKSLD
jgi:hypothetical protein